MVLTDTDQPGRLFDWPDLVERVGLAAYVNEMLGEPGAIEDRRRSITQDNPALLDSGFVSQFRALERRAKGTIEALLNRRLEYAAEQVETFPASKGAVHYFSVSRWPVDQVQSVVWIPERSAVDSEHWEIDNEGGLLLVHDDRPAWLSGYYQDRPNRYRVQYSGGYVTDDQATDDNPRTLPLDLSEIALDLAAWYYYNRQFDPGASSISARAETGENDGYTVQGEGVDDQSGVTGGNRRRSRARSFRINRNRRLKRGIPADLYENLSAYARKRGALI